MKHHKEMEHGEPPKEHHGKLHDHLKHEHAMHKPHMEYAKKMHHMGEHKEKK